MLSPLFIKYQMKVFLTLYNGITFYLFLEFFIRFVSLKLKKGIKL